MADEALVDWLEGVSDKHGFTATTGAPSGPKGGPAVKGSVGKVGMKTTADGTTLSINKAHPLGVIRRNFAVGPVPCYTKGSLSAKLAGSVTVGKKSGGSLTATCSGSLELGVGASKDGITAGAFGALSLSASHGASVTYSEKDGLDVQPFTFKVMGNGTVGLKIALDSGEKLSVEQPVASWELFVVTVGRYRKEEFESIDISAGKDMERMLSALSAGGAKIEALVEEYAPEPVKKAAVAGAEWVAESDTAGDVEELVQDGLDYIEDETGVDAGEGVERLVQSLIDEHGETSGQATARVNKENADFDTRRAELNAMLEKSGLKGDLAKYRTSEEFNAIWDVWQKETEAFIKGKPSPETWRQMVVNLAKKALEKKKEEDHQKKVWEQQKKQAEDEKTQAAVQMMEGARAAAQSAGVGLDNKLRKTPNAEAQKYLGQGWHPWKQAEDIRNSLGSLQGPEKANRASQAAQLYQQSRQLYKTGLQYAA